jgi:hypothetical protein
MLLARIVCFQDATAEARATSASSAGRAQKPAGSGKSRHGVPSIPRQSRSHQDGVLLQNLVHELEKGIVVRPVLAVRQLVRHGPRNVLVRQELVVVTGAAVPQPEVDRVRFSAAKRGCPLVVTPHAVRLLPSLSIARKVVQTVTAAAHFAHRKNVVAPIPCNGLELSDDPV